MMTGKVKLYFLLDAINDARAITPFGQPLIIDPTNDLKRKYRDIELKQLFVKFEKDEKILKVLQAPNISEFKAYYDENDDGCWHIKLLPAFDNYYLKIQYEPEYQEFTGRTPVNITPKEEQKSIEGTIYEITYTPSREILLNKTFQLAKPDFDTENDLVFGYLYKHPNKKFTKQELEEAIDKKLTKDLHKIVENLGFKADLRRIFFSVSATSISFKNPITQEDLDAFEIQKIKIS